MLSTQLKIVHQTFDRFSNSIHAKWLSVVTDGGLIFGAEKSHTERNLAVVEGMFARLEVLPFDEAAATHFGQLRTALQKGWEFDWSL